MSEGFDGLLDFVGYSVGEPVPVTPSQVTPGFYGLLDFTGIPVGVPSVSVPTRRGPKVAGKKPNRNLIRYLLELEIERAYNRDSKQREYQEVAYRSLAEQTKQKIEIQRRQEILTTTAVYTTLFAEL